MIDKDVSLIAKGLVHTQLAAGVHQLVLHDVESTTLKEFTEQLKTIMEDTPSGGTMRLMISISSVPSIQQLLTHVRQMRRSHHRRPTTRVAVIYSPSLQLFLLNMIVRSIARVSTVRFFLKKDEDQALEWLSK